MSTCQWSRPAWTPGKGDGEEKGEEGGEEGGGKEGESKEDSRTAPSSSVSPLSWKAFQALVVFMTLKFSNISPASSFVTDLPAKEGVGETDKTRLVEESKA
jgi:hypothetical protein